MKSKIYHQDRNKLTETIKYVKTGDMLVCTVSDGIHACIFLYLGGIGKNGWARCLDIRNELSFHTRCCLALSIVQMTLRDRR